MLLAKSHAVGTTCPPNIATLEIVIQKRAAPDTAGLPVWKLRWNLSGIVAFVLCFQILVWHISA